MIFFKEIEPDIFIGVGALQSEQDGEKWTEEYDRLLAAGRPFAIIVNASDRPQPAAGKPMVLWMKARKSELARLVKATIYVAEDSDELTDLERNLPSRARNTPYPLSVAASEAEAIEKARTHLDR